MPELPPNSPYNQAPKKSSDLAAVLRPLSKAVKSIEQGLYFIRDLVWDYPVPLWEGQNSLVPGSFNLYRAARPYSHFVFCVIVLTLISSFLLNILPVTAFSSSNNQLIEGVVLGVDANGNPQTLSRVNPLIPTSIQLESDLAELIYEPLVRVELDGSVTPVLASSITEITAGAQYQFQLRDDVYWHDGTKFDVDDVVNTLRIVKEVVAQVQNDESDEVSNRRSAFVTAIKQMEWEVTGANSLIICTSSPELLDTLTPEDRASHRCSGVRESGDATFPIFTNFLELLGFKIMPEHLTRGDTLNVLNINTPEPQINRFPVGTGPYRFERADGREIRLLRNESYYGPKPQIEVILLHFFTTEREALEGLQNGEIHSLAATSVQSWLPMQEYSQITNTSSPVLQNQYWALYFNMRKDPDGNPIGPAAFQDKEVRQAIYKAVDKDKVIKSLYGFGEKAVGPIYSGSSFFNPDAGWYNYDPGGAAVQLDAAGWTERKMVNVVRRRDSSGIITESLLQPNEVLPDNTEVVSFNARAKGDEILVFGLAYADSYDRHLVYEAVKDDLSAIGVYAMAQPYSLKDLTEQLVTPKLFDMLLFGVQTFIDPDRLELFHSGEQLNLGSYASTDMTIKIEGNRRVEISRIDKALEQGRQFDPRTASESRDKIYAQFQELLVRDSPVVFLYHPKFIYYHSKRLSNVDMTGIANVQQRFRNIAKWSLR